MKLFLDTANIDEIKEAVDWGVISGVTTNPSLAAKENQDFIKSLITICEMVDGPVSAEVISLEYEGMLKEARKLAGVHSNVVVKIPIVPEGMKAVKTLSAEGIKVNVTLVFSANQALLAPERLTSAPSWADLMILVTPALSWSMILSTLSTCMTLTVKLLPPASAIPNTFRPWPWPVRI